VPVLWLVLPVVLALGAASQAPAPPPASAAETPLPDPETFFAETRANFARSERDASRYAYKERRTELHTNPFGRLGTGGTRAFQVTPTPDGRAALRTLIERDGTPVTDGKTERSELRRRPGGRPSSADDVMSVLAFTMVRRERLDGRDAIVVRFTPKPMAEARTRQGRIAKAFTGHIWVWEAEREVARVEGTASEDLSFGLGVVARLDRGATATVVRRKVDASTWLPTSVQIKAHGRAMLLRRLTIDHAIEWFDYMRVRD
jgi:hypothetical protein